MKRWLAYLLALMLAIAPLAGWAAATYTMKITPSMPKGSAGEKLLTTQPTSTKLSPCNSSALVDAVSFALAYNAGSGSDLLDVYMFFFDPNADGVYSPKYYVVSKASISGGGLALVSRYTLEELTPATDMYMAKESNPGGAITESLLSSFISVDGVPSGTWQLIGIVADRATLDFDNPNTWLAWDVATVMLRKPWPGSSNTFCQ
jgi:hypothetical protein